MPHGLNIGVSANVVEWDDGHANEPRDILRGRSDNISRGDRSPRALDVVGLFTVVSSEFLRHIRSETSPRRHQFNRASSRQTKYLLREYCTSVPGVLHHFRTALSLNTFSTNTSDRPRSKARLLDFSHTGSPVAIVGQARRPRIPPKCPTPELIKLGLLQPATTINTDPPMSLPDRDDTRHRRLMESVSPSADRGIALQSNHQILHRSRRETRGCATGVQLFPPFLRCRGCTARYGPQRVFCHPPERS